jgi:hypothetical protein
VITYDPGATLATVKVAVTFLVTLLIAHEGVLTGVPETEQVLSLKAKSELLVMVTMVPGEPDVGIGAWRAGIRTWMKTVPVSPAALPVTVIKYVPGTTFAMTNCAVSAVPIIEQAGALTGVPEIEHVVLVTTVDETVISLPGMPEGGLIVRVKAADTDGKFE